MEIKNGLWSRAAIRALIVLGLVGAVPLTASSAGRGYAPQVTPAGTGFKLKLVPSSSPTAVPSQTASGVNVTSPVSLAVSATGIVQATAAGAIGGAQVGGSVGAAIGAVGGLAIAAIPVLYEMFQRANVRVKPDGTFEEKDLSVCSVAPCYVYSFYASANGPMIRSDDKSTALAAIQDWAVKATASQSTVRWDSCFVEGTAPGSYSGKCTSYIKSSGALNCFACLVASASYGSVPPLPVAYVPATVSRVQTAISANPPTWAEIQALMDLQFPPEVTTPVITGPAKQFMGNTVELLSPNERKQVEEWKNMDYSTPGEVKVITEKKTTITSDAKTETTTTVNADGTTSVSTKQIPAQTKTETTLDTNEPAKEDPCKLFPGRIGCLDIDTPGGDIPRSTKTITFQEENVFGAGSCPANMTASIATLGKTVTVWDWAKTCERALPLRALVLLLASFAAFLIVMPGSTKV